MKARLPPRAATWARAIPIAGLLAAAPAAIWAQPAAPGSATAPPATPPMMGGGMPNLRAILSLGRIAHDSVCTALAVSKKEHAFAHGARHALPHLTLISSYHCSRLNTNTGVLTPAMFEEVVRMAKQAAEDQFPSPPLGERGKG